MSSSGIISLTGWLLGFSPYILGGLLQERSGLLPEILLLFKAFYFVSSDVCFVLHLVEKGDGIDNDFYSTPSS